MSNLLVGIGLFLACTGGGALGYILAAHMERKQGKRT